jgi:hypothetical protein
MVKIIALLIVAAVLAGCYENGAQRNSRIDLEKRVKQLERDADRK